MPVKQVIVMRKDLNMRKGKMVAQGAHASLAAYKRANKSDPAFIEWDTNSFTKICVGVNSEAELIAIADLAKETGLNYYLICDNGTTEFNGIPTFTCVGIGPDYSEKIDSVTGHLSLL